MRSLPWNLEVRFSARDRFWVYDLSSQIFLGQESKAQKKGRWENEGGGGERRQGMAQEGFDWVRREGRNGAGGVLLTRLP
jgi:hypothetical protein